MVRIFCPEYGMTIVLTFNPNVNVINSLSIDFVVTHCYLPGI